jgi:hypothetical protein
MTHPLQFPKRAERNGAVTRKEEIEKQSEVRSAVGAEKRAREAKSRADRREKELSIGFIAYDRNSFLYYVGRA